MNNPTWAMEMDMEVRFRDTDAMGHVNNAVYHSWFEMARVEYFRRCLEMKTRHDYAVILAHQAINFRFPVELGAKLRVAIKTNKIGRTSITHEYAIWDAESGTPYCDGSSVIVWYDYVKQKPVPVPGRIRKLIAVAEPQFKSQVEEPGADG